MWQRFTEEARKVVFYAVEEAQRSGAERVDDSHLLLGLTRTGPSVASRVLQAFDVTLAQVREGVERRLSKAPALASTDLTLTSLAKEVIRLATEEASRLGNARLDVEHLLLGFLLVQEGVSNEVLRELGLEVERARLEVEEVQALEPRREEPPPTEKGVPKSVAPPPDPWAGLAPLARRAIVLGEMEALRRGQTFLSPEHLLLGLLREDEGATVRALDSLGVDREALRAAVSAQCRDSGVPLKEEAVLSPATGNAIRIATQEQVRLRATELDAEHLLLGLLREPDGIARRIVEELGLDADRVRSALARVNLDGHA